MEKKYLIIIFTIFLAIQSGWQLSFAANRVSTRLVAEGRSIVPGQPFWLALEMTIAPEWHIYWLNPGDAGMAPTIRWQLPPGFKAGQIQWPYPKAIPLSGLVNFGYEDRVLLLTEITPSPELEPGGTVTIRAQVEWLVCKEECLPESTGVVLRMPVTAQALAPDAISLQAFADARARLPLQISDWKFTVNAVADTMVRIRAEPPSWHDQALADLTFFPGQTGIFDYAAPQRFRKIAHGYELEVRLAALRSEQPVQLTGVLVTSAGWRGPGSERAIEIDVPTDTLNSKTQATTNLPGKILLSLLFAFIGGILLNAMPCVLPVLSLKVLGFVQQAGASRRKTFEHGLSFTAGVLISFWVLAGVLILLRAGGDQLGWGFQLQSPEFLMTLAILLFLFGLSLLGIFEIGTSLTGLGRLEANKSGRLGSFTSGVLATIVATPCTAPFMGSALGFAIGQPPAIALLIFTSLGLGMAFPYLLLSMAPGLLRFIPGPGPWMETFKQFMGFLLLGTVVWLIWVLGIQTGITVVTILLMALLATGLAAWIMGRWALPYRPRRTRSLALIVGVLLILSSLASGIRSIPLYSNTVSSYSNRPEQQSIIWQPFSQERLTELLAANQRVFVNFTAAWCLSCQVNERVAFSNPDVQRRFKELNILTLKADWTNRDEQITRALAQWQRNSVPLYLLFDGRSDPLILPEILTPGIVLDLLNRLD